MDDGESQDKVMWLLSGEPILCSERQEVRGMLMALLLDKWFLAFGIPLLLLVAGGVTRKLVRKASWRKKDFYLGVEFALAAISSALAYYCDLQRNLGPKPQLSVDLVKKISATGGFLGVSFLVFLVVLATHQEWEERDTDARQFWWLGIATNTLGVLLMAGFVLLIQR
jgi:hypothetical protein